MVSRIKATKADIRIALSCGCRPDRSGINLSMRQCRPRVSLRSTRATGYQPLGLHGQSRGLPGLDAAGEMSVIGESRRLGNLCGLDGTNARRAGEHHQAALRVRQINRVELR